jgi:hypothetical protein
MTKAVLRRGTNKTGMSMFKHRRIMLQFLICHL